MGRIVRERIMTEHSHCGYCRATFPTSSIKDRVDGGRTPMCPECRVDSVQAGAPPALDILHSHRCGFGHVPSDEDPEAVRVVQRVSERLTCGDAVPDDALLNAIEARALYESTAPTDGDDEPMLWFTLMHLDAELQHHRERFLVLPLEQRNRAWRAGGMEGDLPYFCAETPPRSRSTGE
jgi:hypothetical protein